MADEELFNNTVDVSAALCNPIRVCFPKVAKKAKYLDDLLVRRCRLKTVPTSKVKATKQSVKKQKEPSKTDDPDAKESKVFVDAITQTEAFVPKVEIATQTDRPNIYSCILCYKRFRSSDKMVSL